MPRVLFIGGPGRITSSTIDELRASGWEIALLTRPKALALEGVKVIFGDRNDRTALERGAKIHPDVVVDSICFDEHQAAVAAEVFSSVDHYVFLSTIDVYGYPFSELPVSERSALRPPNTPYAAAKRRAEETFLAAHIETGLPVTLARVAYSLGEGFLITPFSKDGRGLVQRLRQGLPVVVPGDGTTMLQPACAFDTGRQIAAIVGNEDIIGRPLNLAGPRPLSHDEYIRAIGAAVGAEPRIVHIPTDLLLELDEPEICDGLLPGLTRFPHVISNRRFDELVPDFERQMSLSEGITSFVERQKREGLLDEPIDAPDDRLLARWHRASKTFLADGETT